MRLVSCSESVVDNVKIFLFSEYKPSDLVQNYFLKGFVNSFKELEAFYILDNCTSYEMVTYIQLLICCHQQRNVIRKSLWECRMATAVTLLGNRMQCDPACNQEHQKCSVPAAPNSLPSISQQISASAALLTFCSTWRCCRGVRD